MSKDIFDTGFILNPDLKLESNDFNKNGEMCKDCKGSEKCELLKRSMPYFCFEGFQKHMNPLSLRDEQVEFFVIDSILYHLNKFPDSKKVEMNPSEKIGCLMDLVVDEEKLSDKPKVIYRLIAKQVLDILRNRGYQF